MFHSDFDLAFFGDAEAVFDEAWVPVATSRVVLASWLRCSGLAESSRQLEISFQSSSQLMSTYLPQPTKATPELVAPIDVIRV